MYADIEAAFKQLWQQLRRVQDGRRQEEREMRESGSTPGSELLRYLRDELRGVLRFVEARFSCDPRHGLCRLCCPEAFLGPRLCLTADRLEQRLPSIWPRRPRFAAWFRVSEVCSISACLNRWVQLRYCRAQWCQSTEYRRLLTVSPVDKTTWHSEIFNGSLLAGLQ